MGRHFGNNFLAYHWVEINFKTVWGVRQGGCFGKFGRGVDGHKTQPLLLKIEYMI